MHESNKRLRKARQEAGFKWARAAALKFGWPISTYASHENGQTPVPKEDAPKYARAFGVTAAWLLAIDDQSEVEKLLDLEKALKTAPPKLRSRLREEILAYVEVRLRTIHSENALK
jgi:transcriptional regulator with XRE-family HTH domain